jgi:serine/threonine protein kinase
MEYVPNGMLSGAMNYFHDGFPINITKFYAAQLVLTIEYMQSQNIAHRDLKPGNMMLDENYNLKLIDFGEAKVIDKFQS